MHHVEMMIILLAIEKNGGSDQCCECFIKDSEKYCETEDDVACIMPETRCTEEHIDCREFGVITGTVESGCSCYDLAALKDTHYGVFVTVAGSKRDVTVSTETESKTIASTKRTLLGINTIGQEIEVMGVESDNYKCSIVDGPIGKQSHSQDVEISVRCTRLELLDVQATVVSILLEINEYVENNSVDEAEFNNLRTSIFTMVARGYSKTICSVWIVGDDFQDNLNSMIRIIDVLSTVNS